MTSTDVSYAPPSLPRKLLHETKTRFNRTFDAWYDRRLRIDASGVIAKNELENPGPNACHSLEYNGTPHAVLSFIFYYLRIAKHRFTFVDFGSGKGRVLARAARYPFARVEGVELSPKLHLVAQENLKRLSAGFLTRSEVVVHNQDVLDYTLPTTPLVMFFFNSFDGVILRHFMERVERSLQDNPRDCYFVYLNPHNGNQIERYSPFREIPFSRFARMVIRIISPWPLAIYAFRQPQNQ